MNPVQTTGKQRPSHRVLAFRIPALLRKADLSQKSIQKPPKSDHFTTLQFTNYYYAATYNFNALKCTDSSAPDLNPNHSLNLNRFSPPQSRPLDPSVATNQNRI